MNSKAYTHHHQPHHNHSKQTRDAKNAFRNQVKNNLRSNSSQHVAIQSQRTIKTLKSLKKYQEAKSISVFFSLPHELQTKDLIIDAFDSEKHVFLPRVTDLTYSTMEMYQVFNPYDYEHGGEVSVWKILEPTTTISPQLLTQSIYPHIMTRSTDYQYITMSEQYQHWQNMQAQQSQTNSIPYPGNDSAPNSKLTQPSSSSTSTLPTPVLEPIPRPNLLLDDDSIAQLDLLLCPFVTCDLAGNRIGYGGGFYDRYIARIQTKRAELGLPKVSVWAIGLQEQVIMDEIFPFEATDIKMDAIVAGDLVYGAV